MSHVFWITDVTVRNEKRLEAFFEWFTIKIFTWQTLFCFSFALRLHWTEKVAGRSSELIGSVMVSSLLLSRLWNSLPSSVFSASFNLSSFKRQVYHHLRDKMACVFFYYPFRYFINLFYSFHCLSFPFLKGCRLKKGHIVPVLCYHSSKKKIIIIVIINFDLFFFSAAHALTIWRLISWMISLKITWMSNVIDDISTGSSEVVFKLCLNQFWSLLDLDSWPSVSSAQGGFTISLLPLLLWSLLWWIGRLYSTSNGSATFHTSGNICP